MTETEIKHKVQTIMDKMGYTCADLLKNKYKSFSVLILTCLEDMHSKYEGLPFYVLFNEQEVRVATYDEQN